MAADKGFVLVGETSPIGVKKVHWFHQIWEKFLNVYMLKNINGNYLIGTRAPLNHLQKVPVATRFIKSTNLWFLKKLHGWKAATAYALILTGLEQRRSSIEVSLLKGVDEIMVVAR
jgi:hypothetical protein